jgi:hypothetical protein
MTYQDKLGVYRVGDLKFYSKVQAIKMHTKTGIHPHWDFNEAVFDSYDWTVEPTENLRELYRQRAQQLRDQYDYIILAYSGGADSQNILDSFTNNNINIDELVSFINYNATGDKENYLNAEAYRVSIPTAEKLKTEYSWIKHRVLDLTDMTIDTFRQKETMFNWIYELNNFFSPNVCSRIGLPLKVKEWADIIYSGKKLCLLWGYDKPRVLHIDGKFLVRFIDFIDSGPSVKSIAGEQPYTDELFYWTPDLPEIVIKQAHLIKNYLSRHNVKTLPFVSKEKSDLAYREIDGEKFWLSNHGVHTLIYPDWNIDTFSSGKPSNIVISQRDTWFFNIEDQALEKYHWRVGLEHLKTVVPEYWSNKPDVISGGLKGCWSKDYLLEV